MEKLTPEFMRYEASVSTFIHDKIMTYCTRTIFERKQEYMQKYGISREFFIKVFNLYCSLSYMTVLRSIKKEKMSASVKHPPLGNETETAENKATGKGGRKKLDEDTKKAKTRNL